MAKAEIPEELRTAAEKVSQFRDRLDKCYTEERYEHFQAAVEKIIVRTMKTEDGRNIIKVPATEAAKAYIEDNSWKTKTFWLPVIISIVSIIVSSIIAYNHFT